VNFDTSRNLIVKNTVFKSVNIHEYTWTSPDGTTHNQTDHVLLDKREFSYIVGVRSFRGVDCGTDHYLVVAKVGQRLPVSKRALQNCILLLNYTL
jgi:hypothetical protein